MAFGDFHVANQNNKNAKMCLLHKRQPENKMRRATALHFWRLSLSVLYVLEKTMCARDQSNPAGSEARGEGRERGNLIDLIETILNHL